MKGLGSFLLIVLPLLTAVAQEERRDPAKNAVVNDAAEAPQGIRFTELGISLYEKFRFESEGELFDLSGPDSTVLIPAGAVLSCIRSDYTLGFYPAGATVTHEGRSSKVSKVFFVLRPTGEVTFHMPNEDGNFFGKKLEGTVVFDPLTKALPETREIRPDTAVEILNAFKGPWTIDRNPERKVVPKGQASVFDGGTEITIVRDSLGKKIAVSYYGNKAKWNSESEGLFYFSRFDDQEGFQVPGFTVKRNSQEEALIARILATLPLRNPYSDLERLANPQKAGK